MKLKQLISALALSFTAMSAMADTFTVNVINGTVGFEHTNVSAGNFTDVWNFNNTDGLLSANGGVFSFGANFFGPNIDFTSAILSGSVGSFNLTPDNQTFFSAASLLPQSFTGPLTLTVNGTSTGGASYAGTFNIAAVPEPESYALMLAGLGLIGFAARRKKSAV